VITLLGDEGLSTEERIELLLSWRHSGFSVHRAVRSAVGKDPGGPGRRPVTITGRPALHQYLIFIFNPFSEERI